MLELPGDDPKKVWQSQPTETNTMTLKLIRSKIGRREASARDECKRPASLVRNLWIGRLHVLTVPNPLSTNRVHWLS